jgi:hypothetical protein
MQRFPLAVVALCGLLGGCHFPIGDRVIQVKVAVVSSEKIPIRGCELSMISRETNRVLDTATDVSPQFLNGFINPPASGGYYFKIVCPNQAGSFTSETFDFARGPYLHDLGTVSLSK